MGVELEEGYENGDISFMTSIKVVWAGKLAGGTLILPSSVVDLGLLVEFRGITVLGKETSTYMSSHHSGVSFTPCPNMQRLGLDCRHVSENIPFALAQSTALTSMKVTAGCVEPRFQFP